MRNFSFIIKHDCVRQVCSFSVFKLNKVLLGRSLDVILLLAAAVGQLTLNYFSLVAALAAVAEGSGPQPLLVPRQFAGCSSSRKIIIQGLHRHPNLLAKKREKQQSNIIRVFSTQEGQATCGNMY